MVSRCVDDEKRATLAEPEEVLGGSAGLEGIRGVHRGDCQIATPRQKAMRRVVCIDSQLSNTCKSERMSLIVGIMLFDDGCDPGVVTECGEREGNTKGSERNAEEG